ncbi:MAG TPA: hypothetical protein VNO32_42035 [Candidatus Acidoferrum sp.]|jgi:hypothetical protein|nr:hypothetical protein [Candidatus Acidoferrum sp.]
MAATSWRKIAIWSAVIISFGGFLAAARITVRLYRRHRSIMLRGAVVKENVDTTNQSPIADVAVSADDGSAVLESKSDFTGAFTLSLRPGSRRGQPISLTFRHPDYQPLTVKEVISDNLYVIRLAPLHGEAEAGLDEATVAVGNVLVRYSTETTTTDHVGSAVKVFQVVNTGNVPCHRKPPCSPDGKWKAQVGAASLDAGEGNVFRNARVTCIAGPCPFTRVDTDAFSAGGHNIKVLVRNWSDTATFLLQADVARTQVGDIVRESSPVIFGRAMNFTLPAKAEGPSIEAEINGSRIVFPLGPTPVLSWADCNVRVEKNQVKDYRCELKPGYRYR